MQAHHLVFDVAGPFGVQLVEYGFDQAYMFGNCLRSYRVTDHTLLITGLFSLLVLAADRAWANSGLV